jgi:hypothetical protein
VIQSVSGPCDGVLGPDADLVLPDTGDNDDARIRLKFAGNARAKPTVAEFNILLERSAAHLAASVAFHNPTAGQDFLKEIRDGALDLEFHHQVFFRDLFQRNPPRGVSVVQRSNPLRSSRS